ncbi:adenylate/guanylate cyclase domain-containing protein [Mesorhizobium xinjiangense]|uniref:adenylate/guanylate cyclase domain-containing protein n=1 Tax=Mesorhizobium xinjiangense TaxID=2678685 RepID=UPI0012ED10B4|nr:adenylate/guanylate cyclase domain-containing protein [Mesorhizobium xinjiangense]
MALAERFGTALSGLSGMRQPRFSALLDETFEKHERESRRMYLRGRTLSLLAVMALVLLVVPYPAFLYYHLLIVIFIADGFVPVVLERFGLLRPWHSYLFVTIDFALITFVLLSPNPWSPEPLPPQMALSFQTSVYLYLLLAGMAFADRPKLVIWGGIVGALSWTVGVLWLASLPDSVVIMPRIEVLSPGDASRYVDQISGPTTVDLSVLIQTVVILLIMSAILAAGVSRSRRLVWRHAQIERQRMNLARYFAPATADVLAKQDEPLARIKEFNAAIMFADLVGFTRWSERHSPAEAIGLLREVHAILEEAVFRHGGTLDKFIGDGVMATFGMPTPLPRDSLNALTCTRAIIADIAALNRRRTARGDEPVQVAVGLHYGPVVVGNIGTERRLELGVIGDTVNVASRLEELTRTIGRTAVVSDGLIADIRARYPDTVEGMTEGFEFLGPNQLEGRRQGIAVWASHATIDATESRALPRRRQ